MHIHKQLFLKLMEAGFSEKEAADVLGIVLEFVQSAYCQGYSKGFEVGFEEGTKDGRKRAL